MLNWIRRKLLGRARPTDDFAFRMAQKVFSSVRATFDRVSEYVDRSKKEQDFPAVSAVYVELAAFFLHWASRVADANGKRAVFAQGSSAIVEELFLFLVAQNLVDAQRGGRDAFRDFYFERLNLREQELGSLRLEDDPDARQIFLASLASHVVNCVTPFFLVEHRFDHDAHNQLLTKILGEMFG
jgi:hypothetical protein